MCPNCASCDRRSTRVDETPYQLAARSATMLRRFGDLDAAADVLTALASVKIANFLQFQWCCLQCGVRYDD